jgi:hypothetical protein
VGGTYTHLHNELKESLEKLKIEEVFIRGNPEHQSDEVVSLAKAVSMLFAISIAPIIQEHTKVQEKLSMG